MDRLFTLIIELYKSSLVLRQLSSRWNIIDLPLQGSNFSGFSSLPVKKKEKRKCQVLRPDVSESRGSQIFVPCLTKSKRNFCSFSWPASYRFRIIWSLSDISVSPPSSFNSEMFWLSRAISSYKRPPQKIS